MSITILLIIYVVLLFMLGIWSHKQIKQPLDFFVAGRHGSSWDITGSLLATVVGSSAILGTLNLTVQQGWAAMWFLFSASLGLFLLVPKVASIYSHKKLTLPQLLEQFYGKRAKQLSSIIIPTAWVGIVAAQVVGASKILTALVDLSYSNAVFISGGVLILYTMLGGQISILKTDKIQAFIIYLGLFFLAAYLFYDFGFSKVAPLSSSFPFNPHFEWGDLIVLMLTYSTTFLVGPDIYSRIFSASSPAVAKKSVALVALMLIPFSIVLCYIGMHINGLDLSTQNNSINFMIFLKYNSSKTIFALGSLALLSAVLSSADTTLLSASIILVDAKKQTKIDMVKSSRIMIFVLGLLAIWIAIKIGSIITILLTALAFYSGAFIVPMFVALYTKKQPKGNSVVAMLTGGVVALLGKIMILYGVREWGNVVVISGFVVNFLILFYGHHLKIARRD